MKGLVLLTFLALSGLAYGQKSKLAACDCNALTMQGKNNKSAYLDKIPFSGICVTKNAQGFVTQETNYYNGQLEGETKIFYPNGKIKEVTEYAVNMKHGKYILYNENEKPIIEGIYKNNQKDGKWKYYNKITGNLNKTIEYEFGKEKASR